MPTRSTLFALLFTFIFFAGCAGTQPVTPTQQVAAAQARAGETPTTLENPALVQQYQATITPDDLAAYLYVYASDYFQGRESGTYGEKLAVTYLAGQYRKLGLKPAGNAPNDDPRAPAAYFQNVPLYETKVRNATLTVLRDGETVLNAPFSAGAQSGGAFYQLGSSGQASGGLVFAGYGIADDQLGYNDFAALQAEGIDASNKFLLILADEPLASAEQSLLKTNDQKPSAWTRQWWRKYSYAIQNSKAAGLLIVSDAGPRARAFDEQFRNAVAGLQGVGNLSLDAEPQQQQQRPPVFSISTEAANQLLASTGRTVQQLQQEINQSLKPVVFEVPDATVQAEVNVGTETIYGHNVAALVEGSDPVLKNEIVVVSAHLDHDGINPMREGDQIYNGADDDGSGTVALLEMAEAFMKAKEDGYGPRRSVLFLHVTAEEKGLLGSRYYSDMDPLFPLENTVTNLNIDMIGRFDPTHPTGSQNYVYIIGSNLISQELHDLNASVNQATDINIELDERFNSKDDPNQFYRRSDHWNFGKHGIPFIFFFTGTHEDYHQPGDEPHKIEYDRMARITRLIFGTAWQVANQDERPAVSGTGFND